MTPAEFDLFYARCHEDGALQECVSTIAAVLGSTPAAFDWLWRAAKLEHFQAMQAQEAGELPAAKAHFSSGAALARRAQELSPIQVEGVFWRGVCDLEAARLSGKLAAARTLGPAEKQVDRAARLDEAYHYAGPLRVLGRIAHLKPFLIGGSLDAALAYYNRALQIAPENSTTLLYCAEALIHDRQPAAARKRLHQILEGPALPDWVWETERDRKFAQEWLKTRFD